MSPTSLVHQGRRTAVSRPLPRALALRGRIDAHRVDDLGAMLADAMAAGGDVHVDLADARFLDGHAIEVLRDARARLAARGRDLTIGAASTAATVILEMARAAGILDRDELVPAVGAPMAALVDAGVAA